MKRLAVSSMVALAVAGCAMVGPNYQRPPSELPDSYAQPATAGMLLSVPLEWWTLYDDAVLNDLVSAGLARNTDVRLATARVEEAEAVVREARATLLFPQIDAEASAARRRASGVSANDFRPVDSVTTNNFRLGVFTAFELDIWGRLRRAELAVREQLLATQYAQDTVALTLAASVARTYFAVRSLDAQLIASNEILRAADESLGLARKRVDAGVASELDVYQASSLRTQAAAQAKEIARQRATFVHQLGVLSGGLDLTLQEGDIASLPIPPLAPPGLPSTLLERRPDVREAEANLAAATHSIGVARAAQFPTVRLTAALGTASTELGNLFSSGSGFGSLGLGLVGPLLDGGRYAARTQQAEARARQAEALYQRVVHNAFREVSDALSNVRLASEAETDLGARVDAARRALRLATLRYESGYSAYLEVLDAQRTLNDAQLALIRNRQAYLSYTVDLMNSLGGGWSPPG